jgi:hypothetical protein
MDRELIIHTFAGEFERTARRRHYNYYYVQVLYVLYAAVGLPKQNRTTVCKTHPVHIKDYFNPMCTQTIVFTAQLCFPRKCTKFQNQYHYC